MGRIALFITNVKILKMWELASFSMFID